MGDAGNPELVKQIRYFRGTDGGRLIWTTSTWTGRRDWAALMARAVRSILAPRKPGREQMTSNELSFLGLDALTFRHEHCLGSRGHSTTPSCSLSPVFGW